MLLDGQETSGDYAMMGSLAGIFGRVGPRRPHQPGLFAPPPVEGAVKPLSHHAAAHRPARVTFHRVLTGRANWLAAGRIQDGCAFLCMAETLDPARAIIAIRTHAHRQICLLVAPDGRRIAVRSDGYRGTAVSAVPLQERGSDLVRFQHPCAPTRFLGVTMPGQGGPDGLVIFDSSGSGERDQFTLVLLADGDVTALAQAVAEEFAMVAAYPFTAKAILDALSAERLRPDLAEPLIRVLPADEAAVLARNLLDRPQTLDLLRRVLPANPWSQEVLPALAAWNVSRSLDAQHGVVLSPASDEFAGKPLEGHGVPQAGQILTMQARRQIRPRCAACVLTTMRNEGVYALDWISYHLSIGFDHIIIYTNDNEDGSDALLRRLAGHDVITLIENQRAPVLSSQHKAYSHALMLLPQILDYRWTALIDADEYIGFGRGMFGGIADFITWQEARHVDAIALCWLLHVASRHDSWRDESTLRRFPMRERGVNPHVKSLFRPSMFWHSHPHFPHMPFDKPFAFRTESGGIHHAQGVTKRLAAFAEAPSADLAWINHYIFRSAGEAVLKLSRGRADQSGPASGWQQANLEHTARAFMSLSRADNSVRDERILACAAHQPGVLASIMALPGVAEIDQGLKAAMPRRIADASEAFLAGVRPAGQPDFVRHFIEVVSEATAPIAG